MEIINVNNSSYKSSEEEDNKERKNNIKKNDKKTIAIKKEAYEKFSEITKVCNERKHGRRIPVSEVVEFCAENFKESDIKKIQEQSLSLKDKIDIAHHEYNKKNQLQLSLEEFVAQKLKLQ